MVRHLPHMHSLKHPSRYPLWNHPGPENLTDLGICHLNLLNFLSFLSCRTRTLLKRCPFCEMNWDPFWSGKELGPLVLLEVFSFPGFDGFDAAFGALTSDTPRENPHDRNNVSMYFLKTRADIYIYIYLQLSYNWLNPNEMPQGCTYHNASQLKGISIPQWKWWCNPVQPTDSFNFATFRIHVEKKPELSSRFLQPLGRHAR